MRGDPKYIIETQKRMNTERTEEANDNEPKPKQIDWKSSTPKNKNSRQNQFLHYSPLRSAFTSECMSHGPIVALLLLCGTFCPKKISSTVPFTALEQKPKVALNGSHPPGTREVPIESAFTRFQQQMGETSLPPWLYLSSVPASQFNECL